MRDMTRGNISGHLLAYAVPMILGNFLQLTYNAADSMIIGKCLGETALAAVSTANPIVTMVVLGASGIGIGASVLISRYYGAKDFDKLKREFSTTVIASTIFSMIVFLTGFFLSEHILSWIHTPGEAMFQAKQYLRIIFVSFLFTFQYNIWSSSMRAIGDSKTPVQILGVSCGVNIALDLLFVYGLGFGVRGAGAATVIAEATSAFLCIVHVYRNIPELRVGKGQWIVDRKLLKNTAKLGSLTALQQATQPIGKVLIQSAINMEGVVAVGAFNAVSRVDDYACIPSQSIGMGIMTCTAQNLGAGQEKRVRETAGRGLLVACCYFPIIFTVIMLFREAAVALLSPKGSTQMVSMGVAYLGLKSFTYILACVINAIQGYFRGLGLLKIVLMATLTQISIRTVCVYFFVPVMGIAGEAFACMSGWLVQLLLESTFLIIVINRRKSIDKEERSI